MIEIKFTNALKRFYPDLAPVQSEVDTVLDVIQVINEKYPGIKGYIVDEQGRLRKHVNIFVDGRMIEDREKLSDGLQPGNEVYIMQALSGG